MFGQHHFVLNVTSLENCSLLHNVESDHRNIIQIKVSSQMC